MNLFIFPLYFACWPNVYFVGEVWAAMQPNSRAFAPQGLLKRIAGWLAAFNYHHKQQQVGKSVNLGYVRLGFPSPSPSLSPSPSPSPSPSSSLSSLSIFFPTVQAFYFREI